MSKYNFWRQIGENKKGEAIYRNLETGEVAVEKNHMYLVEARHEGEKAS